MKMEEYKVEGKNQQELQKELKGLIDFRNKITKWQEEGAVECAIRNTITGEEDPVPIKEALLTIKRGIKSVKTKLGEDTIEKQECQSCGGTEKVQIICSDCIEKSVLAVLQRENINPVRVKKGNTYAERLKFHMEN